MLECLFCFIFVFQFATSYIYIVAKNAPPLNPTFIFWITLKSRPISKTLVHGILKNLTLEKYKLAHNTFRLLLHQLGESKTVIF